MSSLHYDSGKEATRDYSTGKGREGASICGEPIETWSLGASHRPYHLTGPVSCSGQSQQNAGYHGNEMIKIGGKDPLPPFLFPLGLQLE